MRFSAWAGAADAADERDLGVGEDDGGPAGDAAGARPAYVYFNNDNHGHAAFNALTLRRMAETEA